MAGGWWRSGSPQREKAHLENCTEEDEREAKIYDIYISYMIFKI